MANNLHVYECLRELRTFADWSVSDRTSESGGFALLADLLAAFAWNIDLLVIPYNHLLADLAWNIYLLGYPL